VYYIETKGIARLT